MDPKWYVVRTKPRVEFSAAAELERDGIEVFSPALKKPHVHSGPRWEPLFPGYIFARCDLETGSWPSFRSRQHVLGLVNFRGELPWLPNDVIVNLKKRCDMINEEGGIWRRYQPGDWVQVVSSTMQGLAQVVEDGKTAQTPVRVLLQLFERLVPVQVPRQDLQPIEGSPKNKAHASRRTRGGGRWIQGFGPRAIATG
jgi:transcriptional antiterminator RfaH